MKTWKKRLLTLLAATLMMSLAVSCTTEPANNQGTQNTACASHIDEDEDGKCDTCGYQLPIEVPEPSDPTVPDATEPDATEPDGTEPAPRPSEPEHSIPATEPSAPQSPDQTSGDDKQDPVDNNGWIWAASAAAAVSILGVVGAVVIKKKK